MHRSTLALFFFPFVALVGVSTGAAAQQQAENHLDALARPASSTATITPIFGQLLMFSMPKEFAPVNTSTEAGAYLQESVPSGQSVGAWTEMIKVTGEKDAATRPGITAQKLAEGIAGFFRKTCPDTFAFASFGPVKVDRNDGFATILSCGNIDAKAPRSETMMLVTIKGDTDLYTLQWAELGPASKTALTIDPKRWQERLVRIAPVRLCPVVPGEAPPYPSCTGKR